MTSFSVVRKKTPFQKHREEEEAKKKRADEEAARLYEEFVESFKVDDIPGGKAFVRGGTINPNERLKGVPEVPSNPEANRPAVATTGTATPGGAIPKEPAAVKKPGSRYVPSFIPPGLAAMVNKEKDSDKRREEDKNKDRDRGKSRNIDHFMEELKREQEIREKRSQDREHRQRSDSKSRGNVTPPSRFDELPEEVDPNGKIPGSFDDGDPQTTNLYVGNLSPQVDENFLLRTFGRFGPIASVKIMWPRTEEERRRQRNCGFVAFMNRGEAQAAKDEMQGVVVYEYELRIGWGKAVALPAQALPAPPPGQMAVRPKEGTAANVAWSGPGAPPTPAVSGQNAEVVVTPNVPDIQVIPPEDEHIRHVIDTMAMYVLDDGCSFEQAIMERGRGNAMFDFLFDLGSAEHTYYIWRLYSFAQGDTLQRWRTEPFIMITGSGRWIPPPLPQQEMTKSPEREKASSTTFAAGRGRRLDQERSLTDGQRDEFEDMLRALTLERSQIREAMGFALDNAEAAGEIVEVLTESLTLKETLIPTKVARLMLVSDVLHNSSARVKNASAYRTGFEARLPDIMESFNDLYRNITGRITAEALKERVLKVLQVWADWFLFSDAYVNGLRATFSRPANSGVVPFHALCGDMQPSKENGNLLDGETMSSSGEGTDMGQDSALAMGEGAAARELASLPLAELERRCRHNGLSIRGGREVMVARLLSLEEAEKQKNQEQDEEVLGLQGYSALGKNSLGREGEPLFRGKGEERWSSSGGWTEVGSGWREVSRNEREQTAELDNGVDAQSLRRRHVDNSSVLAGQWPCYDGDEDSDSRRLAQREVASSSGALPPTLSLPAPELKSFGKSDKADPVLPASKWTREDDMSDDEKQASKGLGLGYSSSGSDEIFASSPKGDRQENRAESMAGAANDSSMDEERRQKLRRLEVAVMEYRETLEERGIKSSDEIERRVFLHRKKLESDYGLSDGPSLSGRDRDSKSGDAGGEKNSSRERGSVERRDRRDESRDSFLKKRTRSRSRSPQRLKDRTRDRERDRERDRDRDRERERNRDRQHPRERERDRARERDPDRGERDKARDDHDRDREKERELERSRDRDKDRDRERDKRSRRS